MNLVIGILVGIILTLLVEAVFLPMLTGITIAQMLKVAEYERIRLLNKEKRERKKEAQL